MVRLYEALERPATGKVAVKLSTGEPGGHNFLEPELIKDLVQKVGGTIVECNTAYGGGRASTENHLKAAADHGFTAIAPVDIMDAEGEVSLPVKGGRHLREKFVGSHYPAYDFTVVLSHFKGHADGRLRRCGEEHLDRHRFVGGQGVDTFGREDQESPPEVWGNLPRAGRFSGVDGRGGQGGRRITAATGYSTSAWRTTCRWTATAGARPEDPKMGDHRHSRPRLDPVALDQCLRRPGSAHRTDHGKVHLIERMESRHGIHTLEHGEAIGLGSQQYELVELE